MYFDINIKLLSGKKYSKSKQTKYSGFLKLGVRWDERDIYFFNLWCSCYSSLIYEIAKLFVDQSAVEDDGWVHQFRIPKCHDFLTNQRSGPVFFNESDIKVPIWKKYK